MYLAVDSSEFKSRTTIPKNSKTVFVFDLPYAIPIPDGVYEVKLGKYTAGVAVKRVQRKEVAKFEASGYAQMRFDKYGKSSFSHVAITLPWIVNFTEKGRKPTILGDIPPRSKAKEIVLNFLNRFIEVVRYISEEYWVEYARYQDILSYEAFYWDGKNKYPALIMMLDTGVGGIGIGNVPPFQIEAEKMQRIKKILVDEEEVDASKIFLLNAKDACLQEDFRLAIIEGVTALEIVLYKFIRMQGENLEISEKELEDFIVKVGLTGNISIVMKMLTKGLEQADGKIMEKCKGAIKIRNNILHEGFREVSSTDTEERIMAIESMIEYLKRLISQLE